MKSHGDRILPHNIRVNSLAPTFIETLMTRPLSKSSSFWMQWID